MEVGCFFPEWVNLVILRLTPWRDGELPSEKAMYFGGSRMCNLRGGERKRKNTWPRGGSHILRNGIRDLSEAWIVRHSHAKYTSTTAEHNLTRQVDASMKAKDTKPSLKFGTPKQHTTKNHAYTGSSSLKLGSLFERAIKVGSSWARSSSRVSPSKAESKWAHVSRDSKFFPNPNRILVPYRIALIIRPLLFSLFILHT